MHVASKNPLARSDDLLSSSLRSLQVTGTLLLHEVYSAPWAVSIPSSHVLNRMLRADTTTRVVAFHLVEFGHCEVQTETGARELLQAGEMIICFGGEAHRICQGNPCEVQSVEALLGGEVNTQHPEVTGHSAAASLVCGVFLLQSSVLNPLLAALPALMRANLSGTAEMANLTGVARLIVEEMRRGSLGSEFVIERLLEVLCAQAVRAWLDIAPRNDAGWVRAVNDPIVGLAMDAIHAQPGEGWSVERLAQHVAMSPSRFAARFAEALGDSPMSYLAKIRMNMACRKLVKSQATVEQIAMDVGYESAAAFNRAFRGHLGLPPGAWRAKALQRETVG